METMKTYESKITYQRRNGVKISIPVEEDCTAVEFLMAVANIMEVAGFATESICNSMRTVATRIEE
jgi:hypothetical protein